MLSSLDGSKRANEEEETVPGNVARHRPRPTGVPEVRGTSRAGRRSATRRCPGVCRTRWRPGSAPRGGVVRQARAAVGAPGAHRELQAAVVAVTGVDRPVATGLARRDGVPVQRCPHSRCRSPAPWVPQRARRRWWPAQTSCGCSSNFCPFAKRAPPNARATRGAAACSQAGELGRAVSVRHDRGGNICLAGRDTRRPPKAIPPSAAPLTRRFVGLKLFAPFGAVWDRTNRFAQSHIGDERSQSDHGKITNDPVNVQCRSLATFDPEAESHCRGADVSEITRFCDVGTRNRSVP